MNSHPNSRAQRGNIVILTALVLPVLLGFTALAIDMGYLFVVRDELQNAADAAAMAGAGYLFQGAPIPNWSLARTKATAALALNKSVHQDLTDGTVEYGYWNTTGTPSGLQSSSITPGPNDLPAVKVTISKASGQNGGAAPVFFANVFGIHSVQVSARATAGVSGPGKIGAAGIGGGGLFPIAISKCMYDNYWNSTGSTPGPKIDPATGQPKVFKIGSNYQYSTCYSGEWTSFGLDANDAPTIRDLITYRNQVELGIGNEIWIQTGVKNTVYATVDGCSARGDRSCEYSTIPVVNQISTHSRQAILAFACIRIDRAVGGNDKYIQVEMSTACKVTVTNGSGGMGPWYGSIIPPRLAQ